MSDEMLFFIYLIEAYAVHNDVSASQVLHELDEKGLTDFVYGMYPLYHAEALENAFADIDSLISTGKPAW